MYIRNVGGIGNRRFGSSHRDKSAIVDCGIFGHQERQARFGHSKIDRTSIDHIVPIITERSIVRWDSDKGAKNQVRWQKIAREAAMQSRSVFLPTIHEVYPSVEKFVDTYGPNIAVADPEGGALTANITTLVIGPEGGFTHQEMDLMPQRVSLPGGILRAETAAVAAGVMLSHMRSHHG